MEDLFTLSISNKEEDFVKSGTDIDLEVFADVLETFAEIPYVGSLIKLGRLANRYQDLHFIRKLAKFLEKEQDVPEKEKEKFLNSLTPKRRKKFYEYLVHYLLRAEDDAKADIMGYIYKERVYGRIDDEMFLRLCSIVDRAFVFDLRALSKYVENNTKESIEANNYINLGLIDNFVGGYWVDEPAYVLNEVGKALHRIMAQNGWYNNTLQSFKDGTLAVFGRKVVHMNPVSSKTKTLLYVHHALEDIANALQYPQTELYQLIIGTHDYCNEVEDIVDSPVSKDCKLKFKVVWYTYNGNSIIDSSMKDTETDNRTKLSRESTEIEKSPLYAVRRQAVLRAMDYFRVPASIRDIARAISRTAWRSVIKEDDVEEIVKTIPNMECVDWKYILRK